MVSHHARDVERVLAADAEMKAYRVNKLMVWSSVTVFIGLLIVAIFLLVRWEVEWPFLLLISILIGVPVLACLAGLAMMTGPIIAVVLAGIGLLVAVFDVLVIEPIAWLLERKHLGKLIKLGSLVLLIIGFHFDLLAS